VDWMWSTYIFFKIIHINWNNINNREVIFV
jgi:hypothetical protein